MKQATANAVNNATAELQQYLAVFSDANDAGKWPTETTPYLTAMEDIQNVLREAQVWMTSNQSVSFFGTEPDPTAILAKIAMQRQASESLFQMIDTTQIEFSPITTSGAAYATEMQGTTEAYRAGLMKSLEDGFNELLNSVKSFGDFWIWCAKYWYIVAAAILIGYYLLLRR
jgi:hypothetical protein